MKVTIYGADWCSYCKQAKNLCKEKGIEHEWIDIDAEPEAKDYIKSELKASSIPQIIVDDEHVGGFTELYNMLKTS